MSTTVFNDSDISARLAEHISTLSQITAVQDSISTAVLKRLEPRMRQGLVRIAVIGTTGAGKSTTINALLENLVLPENPSTSSPIPVWIGYHDAEPSVEIYLTDKEDKVVQEKHSVPSFQRNYCYRMEDIIDKDRSRYNSVQFGAVSVRSPIVRNNMTLIDTLGISATTVDSRKTIRVLDEGVDAVIFITKNSQLNLSEKRFLRQYVLGCSSKANPDEQKVSVSHPILPENLVFVHNCFYGVPSKTAFSESIRSFYQDCSLELTEKEINALADGNTYFIHAQNARMGLLGVYPYYERAPEGCSDEEREAARELELEEKELLCNVNPEKLVDESGITELSEGIRRLSRRLCYGENAVAVKRICELVEVIDGVIQSVDTRITSKNLTITQLENQQERFAIIKQDDYADQLTLKQAMNALSKEYLTSFSLLLKDVVNDLITDCAGQALRTPMPPSFRNDFQTYVKMNSTDREEYLKKLLPDFIHRIYQYCIDQMLKALDERKSEKYRTPFDVMEDVKDFMQKQEIIFQGRIDSLKEANAEELGMFFPHSLVVKQLFEQLGQNLQEKVRQIIADACITGGKVFEQNMGQHIQLCALNPLQYIAGMVFQEQRAKWLWNRIAENLFKPLAEDIVKGIPKHAQTTIYEQTTETFGSTRDAICYSHIQLFVSVEITVERLKKQMNEAISNANQAQENARNLKQTCEAIRKDLLIIQYQLQNN